MADQRRIVIIDPEMLHQELLGEYLRQLGYDACPVSDVSSALEVMAAAVVPAVLIDMGTPLGDSLDVVRQLRAVDPALRVILITGYPTLEGIIKAVRCGVYDFMIKPFGLQDLNDCLERAMAVRREAVLPETVRQKVSALQDLLGDHDDTPSVGRLEIPASAAGDTVRVGTEKNYSPRDSE